MATVTIKKRTTLDHFKRDAESIYDRINIFKREIHGLELDHVAHKALVYLDEVYLRLTNKSQFSEFAVSLHQIFVFTQQVCDSITGPRTQVDCPSIIATIEKIASDAKALYEDFDVSPLSRQKFEVSTEPSSQPKSHSDFEAQMEHSAEIEKQLQQKDKQIQNLQSQIERSRQSLEALNQKLNGTITQAQQEAKQQLNQKVKEADAQLKSLDVISKNAVDLENQSKKLFRFVSQDCITGNLHNVAGKEEKLAKYFRNMAIGMIGGVIMGDGYLLYQSYASNLFVLNWAEMIRLALFFIPCGILATYLARESTKHRKKYDKYIKTYIDLKAIHPFINSLPEAEQQQIKTNFANRVFAPADSTDSTEPSTPIDLQKILLALIKKIDTKSNKSAS
jgi:hypothetical protein